MNKPNKIQKILDLVNEDIASPQDIVETAQILVDLVEQVDIKLKKELKTAVSELREDINTLSKATDDVVTDHDKIIRDLQSLFDKHSNEIKSLLKNEISKVRDEIPVIDYSELEEKIDRIVIPKVPTTEDLINDLPRFGERIRDGLELLNGEERLDKSAIKGLDDYEEVAKLAKEKPKVIGGVGFSIKEIVAGDNIVVDNTNIDRPKISAIDNKVKYDANDASTGYLSEKVVSGTGISLSEGTGGDIDKLKISTDFSVVQERLNQTIFVKNTAGTPIQNAINSITDNSASKRYTLFLDSGTFSESVTMKPYVYIASSAFENSIVSSITINDTSASEVEYKLANLTIGTLNQTFTNAGFQKLFRVNNCRITTTLNSSGTSTANHLTQFIGSVCLGTSTFTDIFLDSVNTRWVGGIYNGTTQVQHNGAELNGTFTFNNTSQGFIRGGAVGAEPLTYLVSFVLNGTSLLNIDSQTYATSTIVNNTGTDASVELLMGVSAGLISPKPSVTDNGNGSLTIGNARVFLHDNTANFALPRRYNVTGGTFTLTDQVTNYIVINYNNGSPIMQATTTKTYNDSSIVPILQAFRDGTEVRWFDWDALGDGLANKIHRMLVATNQFTREAGTGLTLAETGTPAVRTVTITGANVFNGAVPSTLTAFNSSTHTMYLWSITGGVYSKSVVTQYNNTQYSDGTNMQTLGASKWVNNWIYRSISDPAIAHIVLGNQFNSLVLAQGEARPSNLPNRVRDHAILVGRISVERLVNTGTVQSAFVDVFTNTPVTSHSSLTNLGWTTSGHTGTASNLAGFDGAGLASQYTLSGTGTVIPTTTSPTIATPFINTITGGTTASSVLTLRSTSGVGTTDYIAFQTDSQVERMRISSGGNVGIGTSASAHKLEVNGVITSVGAGDLPVNAGTNFRIAGGFGSPDTGRIFVGDGSGWKFHISKRLASVTTDLVTFQDNGNLGIGTASPVARLQSSGATATASPTLGSADGGGLLITNTNPNYGLLSGVGGGGHAWLQAQRVDGGTSAYNLLLNPAGGNVGIGTASPTARLHLPAGTATANSAPLKFTTGTNLTTPEAGVIEYNGTFHLTGSDVTRRQIATLTGAETLSNKVLGTGNTATTGISYGAGVKQTFSPDATNAGLNVGSFTADPSSLSNGDMWYNSTTNQLKARVNGITIVIA